MTHRSWSFVAAACALLACSDDEKRVPSAPVGPSTSGTIARDAGPPDKDKDEDAGPMDAGPPITLCTRISGKSGSESTEVGTWVDMPGDLTLTRQVERWTNDCRNLRLVLEFSDGTCPLGTGHAVTFDFGYQDVVDGVVHGGNNIVGSDTETPGIRVRYTRPKDLDPHGQWGTCDGASGQLVFGIQPVLEPGQYLQARYQLDLTRCAPGGSAETIFLQGAFNVLLRTSHSDACPASDGSAGSGGIAGTSGAFVTGGFGF